MWTAAYCSRMDGLRRVGTVGLLQERVDGDYCVLGCGVLFALLFCKQSCFLSKTIMGYARFETTRIGCRVADWDWRNRVIRSSQLDTESSYMNSRTYARMLNISILHVHGDYSEITSLYC